jgi:hypothetical protein
LQRWISYYLDRNWEQFDRQGQGILGEEWHPPKHEWERHDIIHRMLDVTTASLWVARYYPDMKADWAELIAASAPKEDIFKMYIRDLAISQEVSRLQRDIFRLEPYDNRSESSFCS